MHLFCFSFRHSFVFLLQMCHFVCCCFFFPILLLFLCFIVERYKMCIILNQDIKYWYVFSTTRMTFKNVPMPFWSLKSVVLSFQWIKWGSSFLYIFVFHQAPMPHPLPWSQQYRLLDLVTKLKSGQWSNLIIYWDGDQPYDRSEGFLTITAIAWHLLPSNNHCNCWTKS